MKRNRREAIDQQLDALRAEVPDVGCRGLCHAACTIAPASTREAERIAEQGRGHLPLADEAPITAFGELAPCPLLSDDHRCRVYEQRPMICRLWGAAQGLPCPWGCAPTDGAVLSDADALGLIAESIRVGGNPYPGWAGLEEVGRDEAYALVGRYGPQIREMLARGRRSDWRAITGREPPG